MAKWKLCFVLLLPLTLCLDSEVTLVKTIGSKPDITPVCTDSTNSTVMLIVCKIRTKGNCSLLYRIEKGFEQDCDSRFKLTTKNQTVFLHLSNLTSEDSGNYTCECAGPDGTYILHLNVTVEEDEDASSTQTLILILSMSIGAAVVIMIAGVILGLFCKRICCGKYEMRDGSRSTTSGLPVSETPESLDQVDPDDPYASLQQPASDVYQTISNPASNTVTVDSDNQETDEEESDSSHAMYENI